MLGKKAVSFITASEDFVSGSKNLLYLTRNDRDASNNSIVMACVGWGMRNIVQAHAVVQAEGADGWDAIKGHPASDLVRNPQSRVPFNERTRLTGKRLSMAVAHQLMFDGNAYLHKLRGAGGQTISLEFLPSYAVTPVGRTTAAGVVDYYRVNLSNGQSDKVDPTDMVHIQTGIDPANTLQGLSPLKAVMRQVMTDNEIAVYSHSVVKSPSPGWMASMKAVKDGTYVLTEAEANDIAQALAAKTSGEKAGGVVVPTVPMDLEPLRMTPDQLAIDKLNKLPEERITAVFGIPAIVAGMGSGLERSTFSNMKEAREAATEEFLIPMWTQMADAFTSELLPEFDKTGAQRFWYDTSDVRTLSEDADAIASRSEKLFGSNIINRAEARTMVGQKPGKGDENVWSYMLSPAPVLPQTLPQGPKDAKKVREMTEER